MTKDERQRYVGMSKRDIALFASVSVAGALFAVGLAILRMRTTYWWMGNCTRPTAQCNVVSLWIDYWWLVLLAAVAVFAFLAHWLTRGRLAAADELHPGLRASESGDE